MAGLRVVFFGTPEFAVASLNKLLKLDEVEIGAVFTQPDKPVGRGRQLRSPPVKQAAKAAGLPVRQPSQPTDSQVIEEVGQLAPDLLVVVAYGAILKQALLEQARFGAFNVHASLLPKYRGAAPIQRAIQQGEKVTGVTIMQMDSGMDTGPILLQRALAIGYDDTAQSVHDQLADMGGDLICLACQRLLHDQLVPVEQDPSRSSYAPKLRKSEGQIDWNRSAVEVHNHIRAMHPWPGAFFDWTKAEGTKPLRLQIYPGRPGERTGHKAVPGQMDVDQETGRLRIACQDGYYLVDRLKPASGKPLSAEAFRCGYMESCRE